MLKVLTNDEQQFEVPLNLANRWKTAKGMIQDGLIDDYVPFPDVSGSTLDRVIKYTEALLKFEDSNNNENQVSTTQRQTNTNQATWELEHVNIPDDDLFNLILAANYLDFPELLDATCKKVASELKGKNPEQIRERFKIPAPTTSENDQE